MQTGKNIPLVKYLLKGTRFGLVIWKPSAKKGTFTAALDGGYVATVWKDDVLEYFKVESREVQTQIIEASAGNDLVHALYSEARRKAFNVEKAIADIVCGGP